MLFKKNAFSQKFRRNWVRKTALLVTLLLIFYLVPGNSFNTERVKSGNEIVRFHVRAHSNNSRDQEIKNFLANRLIQIYGPLWNQCQSSEELHALLTKDRENIRQNAQKILAEKGYSDSVDVEFANQFFPARFYGERFFPSGEYASLTVKIGSGKGENWWCVLFPPLCFKVFPVPADNGQEKNMEIETVKINNDSSRVNDDSSRVKNSAKESVYSEEKTENTKNIRFWIIDIFRKFSK